MGWLSDKFFGKRKKLDINKIKEYQAPTQALIDEQISLSRAMMDPNSQQNMMMRNLMSQNAMNMGAQASNQAGEMGAMTGASGGQALMGQKMAQNQATGSVNQHWLQGLQGQFSQGMSGLAGMINQQGGMDENLANAYMGKINASNARRQQNMGMGMNIAGGVMKAFSDRRLKTNIELVGKSPKGYNIYEFDYKNKQYGPDRYRGVMSDEVSFASLKDGYGYEFVNYNHPDLDVTFERIN